MEGRALQWQYTYMCNCFHQFPTWPKYVINISSRFGRLFDDSMSDLVGLKQASDSVDDYLDKVKCALTLMT